MLMMTQSKTAPQLLVACMALHLFNRAVERMDLDLHAPKLQRARGAVWLPYNEAGGRLPVGFLQALAEVWLRRMWRLNACHTFNNGIAHPHLARRTTSHRIQACVSQSNGVSIRVHDSGSHSGPCPDPTIRLVCDPWQASDAKGCALSSIQPELP